MTAREYTTKHPWITGLLGAVVLMVLLDILLWVNLGRVREVSLREEATAVQMRRLAAECAELRTNSAAGSLYLKNSGALSLSAVQEIAKRKGILGLIREPKLRPVKHENGLLEQMVTLTVLSVRREDLSAFLFAVESVDPAIRTKELRLGRTKDRPELVDAQVTFSAYENPQTAG